MCQAANVPVFSGAFTPTEIHTAWQAGASIVKVFPVRGLGPRYIQDVLAPMPELPLMPTGGVDLNNIKPFLDAGAVAVGVGGSLLDSRAIGEGNWAADLLDREILCRTSCRGFGMMSDSMPRPNPRESEASVARGVDVQTIGETMLRFTPPAFERFGQSRAVEMHVGGSESNTAVGLARLGHRARWISRMTDNPLGRWIVREIASHGVDDSYVIWTDEDRVGTYYMERGLPPRDSRVFYDREASAISRLQAADLPRELFSPGAAQTPTLDGHHTRHLPNGC